MNLSDRFKNEWQEMTSVRQDDTRAREILLNKDQREVQHEMIFQECQEGKKSRQEVADTYNVDLSTVYRITYKRKKEGDK